MYIFFVSVFEELPSADNASGFRSGVTSGMSSASTTPMEAGGVSAECAGGAVGAAVAGGSGESRGRLQRTDSQYSQESGRGKNSRVLVASRHLRNDSKTIQLEPRARQHSLEEPDRARVVRTDSRDSRRDAFPRSASRDFKVHSRSDSRDLSLDQLRQLALRSMESLDLTVLPLARCTDEESKRLIDGHGVLRHRRTGSKDLKPPDRESKHKRTSSHHITMEPNELSLQLQKGRSVDHLATSRLDPRV